MLKSALVPFLQNDSIGATGAAIHECITSQDFGGIIQIHDLGAYRAIIEQPNKEPYLLMFPTEKVPTYRPITPQHGGIVLALFVLAAHQFGQLGIRIQGRSPIAAASLSANHINAWDSQTKIQDLRQILAMKRYSQQATVSLAA